MERIINLGFRSVLLSIILLMFSSCKTNYSIIELDKIYESKGKIDGVDIYWSENQVDKNFVVNSIFEWSPFTFWPFVTYKKQIKNNWVLQAVKNCKKLDGDAVIMTLPRYSYVINYSNLSQDELISNIKNSEQKAKEDAQLRKTIGLRAKDLNMKSEDIKIEHVTKLGVAWLGIDFRYSKMINLKEKEANPETIKSFMSKANTIVSNEPDKYNFREYFVNNTVSANTDMILSKNKSVDYNNKISNQTVNITEDQMKKVVDRYDFSKVSQDIGLIFIAENFNKKDGYASYWYVLVNTRTKDIISASKVKGAPGGSGFLNYWTGSMVDAGVNAGKHYKKLLKSSSKK